MGSKQEMSFFSENLCIGHRDRDINLTECARHNNQWLDNTKVIAKLYHLKINPTE